MRSAIRLVIAAICLTGGTGISAQEARERIERGKAATAFVELTDGSASAVCIDAKGIFLTNEHVISGLKIGATFKLVLDTAGETPRELTAKVLRADRKVDLAVVQIVDATDKEFAFLPLGDDAQIYETMDVTAFGYPFGKKLSSDKGHYPEITVNVGRVSSLRKSKGMLEQIQFDAQVNPGNSGGPLVDNNGSIVGIVNAGVLGTGVNFAIPVSRVKALLDKPTVTFKPAMIPLARQRDEIELEATVEPFLHSIAEPRVQLTLHVSEQPDRTITGEPRGENRYAFKFVPAAASASSNPEGILAAITYADSRAVGRLTDVPVRIDETPLQLGEIASIEWQDGLVVQRHDGSQVVGSTIAPAELLLDLGGVQAPLNLTGAKRADLRPLESAAGQVDYTLTVSSGVVELNRTRGELPLEGSGRLSKSPQAIAFKPFAGPDQVIDLPDMIGDAVLGGGGRYLLLHMVLSEQVAIYDLNEGRIIERIPLASDFVWMAAGRDHFVLVEPRDRTIERWSFATFEQDGFDELPGTGVVRTIAMGYAGTGPLLLRTAPQTGNGNRGLVLYDVENMKLIDGKVANSRMDSRDVFILGALAAGDVFAISPVSGNGAEVIKFDKKGAKLQSVTSGTFGTLLPTYDGGLLLSSTGRTYDGKLEVLNESNARTGRLVPITQTRFGLFLPSSPGGPSGTLQCAIWTLSGHQSIGELPKLELGKPPDNSVTVAIPVQRVTPGPVVPGPIMPGPMVPGPMVPGGMVPQPGVRGPNVRGPNVRGPNVRGPTVPVPGPRGPIVPTPGVPVGGRQNVPRPGVPQPGIVQNSTMLATITFVSNFTVEKRVIYVPEANQLIVIPHSDDQLLVKRFDVREAKKVGSESRLLVVSKPASQFRPGQLFWHRIELLSPIAGVEYSLLRAPEGMSVTAGGDITWQVPRDFSNSSVNVTVAMKSPGTQTVEERFVLSKLTD